MTDPWPVQPVEVLDDAGGASRHAPGAGGGASRSVQLAMGPGWAPDKLLHSATVVMMLHRMDASAVGASLGNRPQSAQSGDGPSWGCQPGDNGPPGPCAQGLMLMLPGGWRITTLHAPGGWVMQWPDGYSHTKWKGFWIWLSLSGLWGGSQQGHNSGSAATSQWALMLLCHRLRNTHQLGRPISRFWPWGGCSCSTGWQQQAFNRCPVSPAPFWLLWLQGKLFHVTTTIQTSTLILA